VGVAVGDGVGVGVGVGEVWQGLRGEAVLRGEGGAGAKSLALSSVSAQPEACLCGADVAPEAGARVPPSEQPAVEP
jgi:hypothetical protein